MNIQLSKKNKNLSIERKIASKIAKSIPGVGEKSIAIAESLIDAGLSPAMTSMLLEVVFTPPNSVGRGHGIRWKWFNDAVQRRYSGRIAKIQNNVRAFRNFLAEMDDLNEMRDACKGEGFSVSFERSFLFQETGEDSESVLEFLSALTSEGYSQAHAVRILSDAAMCVKNGFACEIQTAIDEITCGQSRHEY